MSFQYTYDVNGKPVGVFIPINEWEKLTMALEKANITAKFNKSDILKSIKRGLNEVESIKQGKIKSIPLQQLLNEL